MKPAAPLTAQDPEAPCARVGRRLWRGAMQMGRGAVAITALAMVLVLAGCGSPASTGSSHLTEAEFEYLAGYGASSHDQPLRDRAERIVDQRCMGSHGFKYLVSVPASGGQARSDTANQPYLPGIGTARTEELAVARRRESGYHLFGQGDAGGPGVPANDAYVRTLSPDARARYTRALFGPSSARATIHLPTGGSIDYPTQGCVAAGQTKLYGSPTAAQNVLTLPQSLLEQVVAATQRDRAVTAKGAAWSKCVTAATGHHFATPRDIVHALQRAYAAHGRTQAVHRREIAYSVADTRCTFRTGLTAAYARVFRHEADAIAGPTRRALLRSLETEHQATARAERILASVGGAS
jgi:hypothetical protein